MLKKYIFPLLLLSLFACNTSEKKEVVTDIEVATAFIKSIQNDDFKEAAQYLLKDETNQQYLERFQKFFDAKGKEEREKYKNSDIIINENSPVSDSVTVINYSNSFNREVKNKVKVVRINGKWLIDFKYTFSGNL